MSSCHSLTKGFRNELIDLGHQFSIHSEILQGNKRPAFDVHGIYPERDCVVFASDELIYD